MTEETPPRLRRAVPERAARLFLPACGAEWTAAEILHATGVQWLDIAWSTAALAAIGYARAGRKAAKTGNADKRDRALRHARHLATGITVSGAWLAAAAGLGPLAGPDDALSLLWAGGALGGAWWLHRHELVAAARDWRRKREDWHHVARRWHLAGSFLLHHESTRLGERYVADVTGTGRLASEIARSSLPERIAQDRGVARNRVEVKEAPGPAGRVVINIRETDPWKHPLTHPVLATEPEIKLPVPCSVAELAVIGQVPETGAPVALPLCDEYGGKVVSVVGIMGAGKTVFLHCLCERITAAEDAILVKINLSFKGYAERDLWAPACLLTALGDDKAAVKRAVRAMRLVNKALAERSKRPKVTADFVPSREDPLIVVMVDESDAAWSHPALAKELDTFATKCREFGGSLVVAGQRGTADFTSPVVRSQTSVVCVGAVNRSGEAMHAAGEAGLSMPNMAEYGEGRPGVWVIGGTAMPRQQAGRTFRLADPGDIRELVQERAYFRPVLPEWITGALGDEYEQLLGSDVFAEWAHRNPPPDTPPAVFPLDPVTPQMPGCETERVPVAVLDRADPLTDLDREAEEHMSGLDDADDLQSWLRANRAKNNETMRLVNEVMADPLPEIPPGQLAKARDERWGQLAEETEIPADMRGRLLGLVARDGGISARQAVTELGVEHANRHRVTLWLNRLRWEGKVRLDGKGRGARWKPAGGDGS